MLVAGKERCIRCMHLLDEEGHCAKCEFDASSYKQPNMALPLGTCLNERYFLGKVLGEGGHCADGSGRSKRIFSEWDCHKRKRGAADRDASDLRRKK